MANQYLTTVQMEARIRLRSDSVQLTDRHLSADIITETNASFREMQEIVSGQGVMAYLERTAPAALSTTPAATLETYSEVDWPTNFTSIHRLDVLQAGEWYKLKEAHQAQQRELVRNLRNSRDSDGPLNPPFWYTPRTIPSAAAGVATVGKVMVYPLPSAGQQYSLWGLLSWVDITGAGDLFPGHSTWLDWVIDEVAIKIVRRDNNAQGTLDYLLLGNEKRKAEIIRKCRLLSSSGSASPSPRRDAPESSYFPRMIP